MECNPLDSFPASDLGTSDGLMELTMKLPLDAYMGVFVAVTMLCDSQAAAAHPRCDLVAQVAVAISMVALSVASQIILIFMMYVYPIEMEEDPYEVGLLEKTQLLREAIAVPQQLNASVPLQSQTLQLCLHDKTVKFSQSIVIFLWALRMLPEILSCMWITYVSFKVPDAERGSRGWRLLRDEGSGKVTIVALNVTMRVLLLSFLILSKLLIALMLSLVGAKFLMFAPNLAQLVIKAFAMGFISSVDALIFKALASMSFFEQVDGSLLRYYLRKPHGHCNFWAPTVTKLVMTVVVTLLFTRVRYGQMQEFREACDDYKAMWPGSCMNCGLHHLPWVGDFRF